MSDRTFLRIIYLNPDIDDRILLLFVINSFYAGVRLLLFMGDLNDDSATTVRHVISTVSHSFDFATVSGHNLVAFRCVDQTDVRFGTIDLRMAVVTLPSTGRLALIGNSDHSNLSVVILMAQAVPNSYVNWNVFLKHELNWNAVSGAVRQLHLENIWSAAISVEVLNEHVTVRDS